MSFLAGWADRAWVVTGARHGPNSATEFGPQVLNPAANQQFNDIPHGSWANNTRPGGMNPRPIQTIALDARWLCQW